MHLTGAGDFILGTFKHLLFLAFVWALSAPAGEFSTECELLIRQLHTAAANGQPLILGAGPVGSGLALQLANQGMSPIVIEKRPDPRLDDPDSGRTFNITLANRGIEALPPDVRKVVMATTSPSKGRLLHLPDGNNMQQLYGRLPEHEIHAIARIDLQKLLVDAAENRGVQYLFDVNIVAVDLQNGTMDIEFTNNGKAERVKGLPMPTAIGTDGVNSVMRPAIAQANGSVEATSTLSSGYRAFQLPPGHGGKPVFEHGWLHLWPREDMVITGIPNKNGSFSMILVLPLNGPRSFDSLDGVGAYQNLFDQEFPDLLKINRQLPSIVAARPLGLVRRTAADRWNFGQNYLIMGDAAHGMSYYFGQGTNVGLEDTAHFGRLVAKEGFKPAVEAFGMRRKPETDIIQDMSDGNQKVLSDKAAKPDFNFRLKLENELVRRFSEQFRLRYEFVVFSTIDFRVANQRIEVQETIMNELTAGGKKSLDDIDWAAAEKMVKSRLSVLSKTTKP